MKHTIGPGGDPARAFRLPSISHRECTMTNYSENPEGEHEHSPMIGKSVNPRQDPKHPGWMIVNHPSDDTEMKAPVVMLTHMAFTSGVMLWNPDEERPDGLAGDDDLVHTVGIVAYGVVIDDDENSFRAVSVVWPREWSVLITDGITQRAAKSPMDLPWEFLLDDQGSDDD